MDTFVNCFPSSARGQRSATADCLSGQHPPSQGPGAHDSCLAHSRRRLKRCPSGLEASQPSSLETRDPLAQFAPLSSQNVLTRVLKSRHEPRTSAPDRQTTGGHLDGSTTHLHSGRPSFCVQSCGGGGPLSGNRNTTSGAMPPW